MISHKQGEFIGLSSGEYSDYSFNGLYRALVDIDLADCATRYYESAPTYEWDKDQKDASGHGFGAWLIANGMAEEIDYSEVHCGCYRFDLRDVVDYANKRATELAKVTK